MNPASAGLVAQLALTVLAVAVALAAPDRTRRVWAGLACAALSVAGLVTGVLAVAGESGSLTLALALPDFTLGVAPDRLGGVFIVVVAGVGLLVSWFGIGYATGPATSRTAWVALALFLLGMMVVPAATDVVTFLLAWETMALASAVLLASEHRLRAAVLSATIWYTVMTHLSFVLLLGGFAVLVAESGGITFDALASVSPSTAGGGIAFALLVLGFASKSGLVPLHVWLPRAHPEAPSHVSAAMSAAMVKLGVYGVLLVVVRLMPGGPSWWGVVLLILGAASAVYGILQASVTSDLKRLLAYSTTENIGLIVLAIGAAVLLGAYGMRDAADVALVASLMLVVSHAAFKATLFLGAGSVLHATGERDLDRLGGLGVRMPWTAVAFGVASLGAAALPVTAGFTAEWTLLQSLIRGADPGDRLVAVAMPTAVAVVALTAGLALLTFVKAFGIGFLARPRSPGSEQAQEGTPPMRTALAVGAITVVAVGLVPGVVAAPLARAVGADGVEVLALGGIDLVALGALLDPVALVLLAAVVAAPLMVAAAALRVRIPRRATTLAWGCGGTRLSPRMQYTATSYAEPLLRVFDDALQPVRDVEVTPAEESRYLVERVQYTQRLDDVVERRLYRPGLGRMERLGVVARRLQNGSIHRYLLYSFTALVLVLLVVAW